MGDTWMPLQPLSVLDDTDDVIWVQEAVSLMVKGKAARVLLFGDLLELSDALNWEWKNHEASFSR